jgi:ribosomal-protein-alanine N-acetyltransferase
MVKRDLPPVVEPERECFPDSPWSLHSYLDELRSPLVRGLLAEDGSGVAGYVVAKHILGEGHILNLGVRAARRRGGLARMLAAAALEWLGENSCTLVQLEVRASNRKARRLYESLGFKTMRRRKHT